MSGIETNPCVFEFSEDERLAELARQSERLSGKHETRSVELLEDDARYLVQEVSDLETELNKWESWYSEAPERGDDEERALLARSEEHTSELQSRLHLVCRL